MDTEYWPASISGTIFPKPMPSIPHDDNPHFINIILTVAVNPQSIPSLEESYKVIAYPTLNFHLFFLMISKELRILPPSQLQNQLDKKAAASVCMRHHSLQGELATLQVRYRAFSDITQDVASRIRETQEQLANITHNIDQVYCDALDALANTPATSDKPSIDSKYQIIYVMHILTDSLVEDDICNMFDKNLSL